MSARPAWTGTPAATTPSPGSARPPRSPAAPPRHQQEPAPTAGIDQRLWDQHLDAETHARREHEIRRTVLDVVTEHLQAAELRHDLAPGLLADTAANPTSATTDDRATVAARLKDIAEHAATAVAQVAADATRTITDQHDHADRETRVATARQRLAETAAATPGDGPTILDATGAHQDWVTAIENLVPATTAADRAAEAAAARATSINRSLTTQSRHPSAETLLRATNGTDSTRG